VTNSSYFLEATYLIASILFVLGLKSLSHPDTARRGMILAACGMAAAVFGTLFHPAIVDYKWIAIGLILGSSIGIPMAMVPMTAMPQRTALSHAFGALAASMVGIAEYVIHGSSMGGVKMGALGLEVMLGSLTVTGSLIAAAGTHAWYADHVQGAANRQSGPLHRHDHMLHPVGDQSWLGSILLRPRFPGFHLWCSARHSYRRC
jgi:NAD/NADP transhydrogenase beta subunit